MGKSNFEVESWKKSATKRLTPDGKSIKDVRYLADGTLIPLHEKDIEIFAGKFPTPVRGGSSSSSWYKAKKPSAVLVKICGTEDFVLYLCP